LTHSDFLTILETAQLGLTILFLLSKFFPPGRPRSEWGSSEPKYDSTTASGIDVTSHRLTRKDGSSLAIPFMVRAIHIRPALIEMGFGLDSRCENNAPILSPETFA